MPIKVLVLRFLRGDYHQKKESQYDSLATLPLSLLYPAFQHNALGF